MACTDCCYEGPMRAARFGSNHIAFPSLLHLTLAPSLRQSINTGLVLGSERFRKEAEQLTEQRLHHL